MHERGIGQALDPGLQRLGQGDIRPGQIRGRGQQARQPAPKLLARAREMGAGDVLGDGRKSALLIGREPIEQRRGRSPHQR